MQTKPIVGVSADRTLIGAHPSHVAGEKYLTAVVDGAQALAVVLPALGYRQLATDIIGAIDGLLFTGSYSNVEPHRYNGPPSEAGTLHDAARDATTLPLLRAAVDAGVPVLAICRGFQEMNVVFGGTLHQNVHTVHGYDDHRESKDDDLDTQYGPSHLLQVVNGGLLSRLASDAQTVHVNSLHAQGIERLGEGLTVEARAPDGLIEAVSVTRARAFALGVQWHPEWKFAADPLSRAIFRAFGDACCERMRIRTGTGVADASFVNP
ncbi:gamma-glutamyl-gamma-aminobutyrate hydrolase family protein [Paraburkholderia rhizosphaerae]|uniref:gamma-glutamyl-gamma-aminobutyrate hydrolase n=1 Tax=Paraburkholderia rhizosphaerae TaxID=480658 RepID=A0A4R8LZL2_9BURK|nr:gamma-glutamyl-gamma-aminobutyrate hydrolase family protein [Paraburkholderia rhizosphaerae]TDY54141.1 gamma-glutamyl-gamma-aminobutyrate hydrolase [Paraburkholderia rhizosphaerae]